MLPGQCVAADYFLSSRKPASTLYVYVGADLQSLDSGDTDVTAAVAEARLINTWDVEFAVRLEALHASGGQFEDLERGDATLSIAKAFRLGDATCFDFVSVEAGYVEPAQSAALSSGIEHFVAGRLHGGATRLGFEAGVTWADLRQEIVDADAAAIFSLGLRGQEYGLNFGFDVLYQQLHGGDAADATLVQLALMKRYSSGDESYLFVRKGISNSIENFYLGFGYSIKFDQ